MPTQFVRPPEDVLHHLTEQALAAAGEQSRERTWVETGSSCTVLLAGATAVRITRQASASDQVNRAQRLVDALPPLPYSVPRSLAEPVTVDGLTAIACTRLPGRAGHLPHLDPTSLTTTLAAIHAVDPVPLTAHLATPRAFMGGRDWHGVLVDQVIPRLDRGLQDHARRRVDTLADTAPGEQVFCHGDIGRTNLHWHQGAVTGVLDWDLATVDDGAEDIAAAATSFQLWTELSHHYNAGTMRRARAFAGTYPLQVVAFALLNDRPEAEVARTVERCNRALADT